MLEQKIEQPSFEAARLNLRPLRAGDAAPLESYAGDPLVARNINLPHPLPPGATQAFLAQCADPGRVEDVWAIDGTRAGLPALVGAVGLERMDRQQSEIGFWIAPQFWNQGLASEAVEAMIAANPHGARTLFAWVFQDNPASGRVLSNAGFEYLGDAEHHSVAQGMTVPTWTYLRKLE
ncbi:50S ribosomal protein acetyltransferase [Candidatus Rhodobacter oscarellae]|uniref:50S ribosomal protein acetyltransferase n=1 Tax=Candidatus Rhodobacter oscarellae TaxID=1675527 RepID=A0A0J9E4C4_9RHOB|nr:GNAT family N-acetyltransferase [Candidatus Rhodobacter lobularis]KMW57582.1 50S ribosomal protein acetyltransferase [Candidatus Rhodobacter lobularis]